MAEFRGNAFRVDARPGIQFVGDEAAIRRLISVLCDNAVKYSPEGGGILLSLRTEGRRILLEARNALADPCPPTRSPTCSTAFTGATPPAPRSAEGAAWHRPCHRQGHRGKARRRDQRVERGGWTIRFLCAFPQPKT
jgi:hypothetical protein